MPGDWWRDAVIYHVYVRSFADGDGDGVGDLAGVAAMLGYLRGGRPSLGVDAVWLSPFFPSPQADFGYDISDHLGVDSVYGTPDDFAALREAAHRRDLRVLIDLVLNHTSTEHPWFRESRSSPASPRRDWYFWRPARADGGPPNNWLSAFAAVGGGWHWDARTREFYLSSFTPGQADLNWRNEAVREAMWNIVSTWLDRGVDGFRVDVAHRIMKDPALADNPAELAAAARHISHPVLRQHNFDHPDVHAVLARLRTLTDARGAVTIGEVPIHDPVRLAGYYGTGQLGLHLVFTFGLWDLPWEAAAFRAQVEAIESSLPPHGWPCYALSNHDIPRITQRYADPGHPARSRVAAVFLLTARGTPCLYYGEEVGLLPPACLTGADVDGRDCSRTPMQWGPAGSAQQRVSPTWLPTGPELDARNVAVQWCDPGSLWRLYRRLIELRRSSAALRRGAYETAASPPGVYAYWRVHGGERVLVGLNFTAEPRDLCTGPVPLRPVLSTCGDQPWPSGGRLTLRPDEAVILRGER